MDKKKHGLTYSQIIGIVWLSIALLLSGLAIFFSSTREDKEVVNDTTKPFLKEKLTAREDSVYKYRNVEKRRNVRHYSQKQQEKRHDSIIYTDWKPVKRRQELSVELNSADTTTLQLVHGIGPVFARRIVRYRERLGGFTSRDQLLEVRGITPSVLAHISPYITLSSENIRLIPINSIELKQLVKHPYIEYYQARDIINLRNNGVVFRSVDDLRSVPSMADSTLQRLLPYIDFSVEK